jgi:hypothetical protein
MTQITEGRLRFTFPPGWTTSRIDEWSFYRNQFGRRFDGVCLVCTKCNSRLGCGECGAKKATGVKAVDILAVDDDSVAWLIEIKDYRHHRRTKTIHIADEFALKVRDSLAMLLVASKNANDKRERDHAAKAIRRSEIRVVLHLEQPTKVSRLRPRAIDSAHVLQRLRQLVKAVHPHPLVLEASRMQGVAWSVGSVNERESPSGPASST